MQEKKDFHVNQCDDYQFTSLPGISLQHAENIIRQRQQTQFESIEDFIQRIDGIDKETINNISKTYNLVFDKKTQTVESIEGMLHTI